MQSKRTTFPNKGLPYLLLFPQLAVTAIFFLWPAGQAIKSSFEREDAFGFKTTFVWLQNYARLFADRTYVQTLWQTLAFAFLVAALSISVALLLAAAVSRLLRASRAYTTLLIWPYAIAPVVAGVLWWFLFNPAIGILPFLLHGLGISWNYRSDPNQAFLLIVLAASWKQVSYNFLFFVAGMQAIPQSLTEAAAIDGAGPVKRFFTIVFPLLSPTTFFLMVMNINYAMFDTFGIIDATTKGGPGTSTMTLVYKVYRDGFLGLNVNASAAQSVMLMIIVLVLIVIQFRWIERRVEY